MRYQVISQYQGHFPISRLCQTVQVSVSGYYAWRQRSPSQRHQTDEQLTAGIQQVYQANRRVYGSPRIHAELREQGWRCGRKRIARLMRQAGISARRTRRRVRTTDSQHGNPVAPNCLQRDFQAAHPNEKWVGDITGVWTRQGWLYLAVVLDLCSRKVIGWAMAPTREDDLVLAALRMALQARHPQSGLLHHARSRQPVYEQGLPSTPFRLGHRGEHEPQGRLL